jgi:hypothetical protein
VHYPTGWVDPFGLEGCPWEKIDSFRAKMQLPVLGRRIPTSNDGLQTVAFVSIENSQFFGMNRLAIPGLEFASKRKEWFRKIYKSTGVEPSTISKVAADAEGLSLVRAYKRITKNGGQMPKEVTIFVERPTCDFCKNYLPLLREST